jgi:hypothetical protein
MAPTPIYLEVGKKRVFACAVDWPGWSRSGKTEQDAIEALATYADRYAPVAHEAGITWPARVADNFRVIERVPGNATTDFGAPGVIADCDQTSLTPAARRRLATLVDAAWTVFDRTVEVTPAELRKGPRGGGRDRDKMVNHVLGAETAYVRKFGVKHKVPALDDAEAIAAMRQDVIEALTRAPSDAPEPAWPARYVARRIAWHALDHAWEMEDRSET